MFVCSDAVLHQFFVDRCRANLHVLLVLEQHEANLQRLIVSFPKMFHLAAMDVVDEWDVAARTLVARKLLVSPETLHLDLSVFDATIHACVEMHDIAKQICKEYNSSAGGGSVFYVTGVQYRSLLQRIKEQLPRKRATLADDKGKYLDGVAKMTEMTASLKRLQDEIAALQPKLQERQAEAGRLMGELQGEVGEAEAARAAIIPEEQAAAEAASRKTTLVADCEAELSKVMPPLLKALKELRDINKSSIAELKVGTEDMPGTQPA